MRNARNGAMFWSKSAGSLTAAPRHSSAPRHSKAPSKRRPRHIYNDRRKFKRSCFCELCSPLNAEMTALASEPHVLLCEEGWKDSLFALNCSALSETTQELPELECASMACKRSEVRPSC